jgi:hypothetical protein
VQPQQPSYLVSVPTDVDRVLALGLAKHREQRIDTAAAFASAFRDALKGQLSTPLRNAADALVADDPWTAPGG